MEGLPARVDRGAGWYRKTEWVCLLIMMGDSGSLYMVALIGLYDMFSVSCNVGVNGWIN